MAFQSTANNIRSDQTVRPGVLQFKRRYDQFPHPSVLHGQPFQARTSTGNECLRQNPQENGHYPLAQTRSAPESQLHPVVSWHRDRTPNGRRRQRLSFTRWNMMISSRYKTELCRQFSEDGDCPFEDKCLFAHGPDEIKPLPRHPKYKTELCRDFHQVGFCSFGPRCNFIHSTADVASLSAKLRQESSRSSTPDSGNESCEDRAGSLSSASSTTTLDHNQEGTTSFHFPEDLYREITGVSEEDISSDKS